jgi:UDP-4-amino-4,6-dideoxy-N-acetyl-beta-L-altrosamine transaminase
LNPIPYGRHHIDEEDINAVVDVLRHGWLTQGPKVPEFEAAVAKRVGAKYAVAVSNGTAALHMACMAAGVTKGDTLVTSPNTFVASANCAAYVGATAAFADIDPRTLNLDPVRLAEKCQALGNVKAIVPVHFAGLPCDMPAIRAVAEHHRSVVIEDAAHALGATYEDGTAVGSCAHSDMTIFSFHPVKIIATGEGGMITTNNEALYRDLLRLRSHGINKGDDPYLCPEQAYTDGVLNTWYYEMREMGFNYRITDVQCALGSSQIKKLDRFLSRRRDLAGRYDRLLSECPHVEPAQRIGRDRSAHHLYVVRINFDVAGKSRNAVMRRLLEKQIICQVHYIPVHYHPFYRRSAGAAEGLIMSERYYDQALSLPLYYGLTDGEQDFVVKALKAALS